MTALERLIEEAESAGSSTSPLIAAARAEQLELVACLRAFRTCNDNRFTPAQIVIEADRLLAKHATPKE